MPNFVPDRDAALEGYRVTRTQPALAGVLSIVCALALAACANDGSTAPSSTASTAGSVASAAPPAPDLDQAAGGISDLSSYVLDIVVHAGDQFTQAISVTAVRDPVHAAHYVYGDVELITIDGRGIWIRQAGTWLEAPGGADAFQSTIDALAPANVVATYSLGLFSGDLVDVGIEQTNGIETRHFHLDGASAPGTGSVSFPADGTLDARIATEGGYLVSMQYAGTNPETGTRVEVSIEVTRVNDPSITVEAPV